MSLVVDRKTHLYMATLIRMEFHWKKVFLHILPSTFENDETLKRRDMFNHSKSATYVHYDWAKTNPSGSGKNWLERILRTKPRQLRYKDEKEIVLFRRKFDSVMQKIE
jgi:hypothetical protein